MGSFYVMISYTWGTHPERVQKLNEKLRAKGIDTWFDKDSMKAEGLNEQMSDAIDRAALIVVCGSERYTDRPKCRKEVLYMDKQGKPDIFFKLEKEMPKTGWFSMIMGDKLYLDISGDDFDESLNKVVEAVEKKLASIKKEQGSANDAAPTAESTTVSHYAKLTGSIPSDAPQIERKLQSVKWSTDEMTQWLLEENITYLLAVFFVL